jgi:hypothetical protein
MSTTEYTPVTTATTSDLVEQARALLTQLQTQIAALGDPGDIAAPNERLRALEQRRVLTGMSDMLTRAVRSATDDHVTRRITALREWHQLLLNCQDEFEHRLASLEALPNDDRLSRFREEDGLRQSLSILQQGPPYAGAGEVLPTLLGEWLSAHTTSNRGRFFDGRWGLRYTAQQIAEHEAELQQASAELARRIGEAQTITRDERGTRSPAQNAGSGVTA